MTMTPSMRPRWDAILLVIVLSVMLTLNGISFLRSVTAIRAYQASAEYDAERLPILVGLAAIPAINIGGLILLGLGRRIGYILVVTMFLVSFGLAVAVNIPVENIALTIIGLFVLWFVIQPRWNEMRWL